MSGTSEYVRLRNESPQTGAWPRNRGTRAFTALALAAILGLAASCAANTPRVPDSPTAAVVDGRTVTLDDIDEAIKDELYAQRFPSNREALLYDARREVLDRIIDDEVVRAAARSSQLSPDAWLAAEVARLDLVTDEEIDAFWKEHEAKIPKDRSEEQVRSDIRAYLEEQRSVDLIASLREEANVRVLLARPRHQVGTAGTPRGPDDAPVTIVEFSDFQCPYCLRVTPTLRQILDRYPDQVRLYYRHLPLPNHPRARAAAEASVCADRQGQFWAYHDLLFESPGAMSEADLRAHAESLELDLTRFDACLSSPETSARVDRDMAAAAAAGVTGTPAFFVNGIRLTGAQPFEAFETMIEEELATKP